jgi:hypothetical protein
MNVPLLVDAIVRQTTVLIAHLATSGGARAPLAHTANQVFLDLAQELKAHGLGHKVIADMFGLALRTYHGKVRRLSESNTFRGQSLWSAVLGYIQEKQPIQRLVLQQRFQNDDQATLRSLLGDLVDSGLISRTGRGDHTTYRAVDFQDAASEGAVGEHLDEVVWVAVHRFGPVEVGELARTLAMEVTALAPTLERLVQRGDVTRQERASRMTYSAEHCYVPMGSSIGWEAALFDHYQAVVNAMCTKLSMGAQRATAGEWVGGSTYHYDVWEGHPLFDEVAGHLTALRAASVALRQRVEAYNAKHSAPKEEMQRRFTAYVGQTVVGLSEESDDE